MTATTSGTSAESISNVPIDDELLIMAANHLAALQHGHQPDEDLACRWHHFYIKCNRIVEQSISMLLTCPMDRGDCVQEVWWHLLRRLKNLVTCSFEVNFEAWLTGLARNQALLILRKQTRNRTRNSDPNVLDSTFTDGKDDPTWVLEKRFERSLLSNILEQLEKSVPATSYRVFVMSRIEGLTAKEIAEELGLTLNQVQSRHFRIYKKFQQSCLQIQRKLDLNGLDSTSNHKPRPNLPR